MICKNNLLTLSFLLFFCCLSGYAQKNIKGLVVDAGTHEALPYVTIKIKNYNRGTTSNDLGGFSLQATIFDTLVFSCIGYSALEIAVKDSDESMYVQLEEIANVLKTITVYNSVTPGFKNIPVESKWQNQAAKTDYGYGILQTFGPGYTIKSPISRFLKTEKEKRKLVEVQKDNSKARGYIEIVNAPDVKDELIKKYSLTEQQYYDILAKFNQVNKKSSYDLDRKSLVHSIFVFFDKDQAKR